MTNSVAVLNAPPVFHRGLADVLHDAGFELEEFDGAERWERRHRARAVALVVVNDPVDLELVVDLRALAPHTSVVTLVDHMTADSVRASIRAGAISSVGTYAAADEVAMVIGAAFQDRSVLPPAIVVELAATPGPPAHHPPIPETEIGWLRALACGTTVATLSAEVGYSEREMHRKLRRVYRRLGSTTRTEALLQAAKCGMLD